MKRKKRNLDRKTQEYAQKNDQRDLIRRETLPSQPISKRLAQFSGPSQFSKNNEIKRFRRESDRHKRKQQSDAAHHCINEKLCRCRTPIRATPKLNQKKCRQEAELPIDEPVKKIQRCESAKQTRLKKKD